MMEFKIDPEFRDVLPSKEEDYLKLEKTVLNDGKFTDPFITWNGFIIDGHTRYRIMQNHPEIDLQPYEKKMDDVLPDRYAAIVWIATHQESRRNLNDFEWAEIHKKAYDAQKKSMVTEKGHAFFGNQHSEVVIESDQEQISGKPQPRAGETATVLAKEFGMDSPSKFKHSVRMANAMNEGEKYAPGFKEGLKSGAIKATKDRVENILSIKDESEREEYVQAIVNGEKPVSPKKAKQPRPMSPQMKDFTRKMLDVVADMETDDKGYGLDDAIRELNGAEDVFFTQIRFVLDERKEVIATDERGKEQVIGFIESVIHDLNELKGEI